MKSTPVTSYFCRRSTLNFCSPAFALAAFTRDSTASGYQIRFQANHGDSFLNADISLNIKRICAGLSGMLASRLRICALVSLCLSGFVCIDFMGLLTRNGGWGYGGVDKSSTTITNQFFGAICSFNGYEAMMFWSTKWLRQTFFAFALPFGFARLRQPKIAQP